MREIKFRAWDEVYGIGIVHELIWRQDDFDKIVYEGANVLIDGGVKSETFDASCPLMQYTGLKDKNGVGIYEGDIIELNGTSYGDAGYRQVIFEGGMFGTPLDGGIQLLAGNVYDPNEVEVIGNIYENPELLEQS